VHAALIADIHVQHCTGHITLARGPYLEQVESSVELGASQSAPPPRGNRKRR
jgi:hypothetical protein